MSHPKHSSKKHTLQLCLLVSYRPLAHAGFPNAGALEAAQLLPSVSVNASESKRRSKSFGVNCFKTRRAVVQ